MRRCSGSGSSIITRLIGSAGFFLGIIHYLTV
jgi:hypothetical protein